MCAQYEINLNNLFLFRNVNNNLWRFLPHVRTSDIINNNYCSNPLVAMCLNCSINVFIEFLFKLNVIKKKFKIFKLHTILV